MSPARGFWAFSVELYGAAGVETACLALQDRFGADVNLVLYCLWAGRPLGRGDLAAAVAATAAIRSRIAGLRAARRALARGSEARAAAGRAELAAERQEQDILEGLAPRGARRPDTAEGNLSAYAAILGVDEGRFIETARPLLDALG